MRIGRFTVERSGRLRVDNEPVDTSEAERRLLAELASRAPAVVPRDQLVDAVWPEGLPAGSRALDMAWARLRKRLGSDGADALTTVRGVGFALRPEVAYTPVAAAADLPRASTPFVGFARELDAVVTWVRTRAGRWLTVSGLGGVGKTRLAAQAAAVLAAEGARPTWIDLAPVGDGDAAVLHVAQRLGLDLSRATDPDTALAHWLTGRAALLFLDNLEHVPRAATRLGAVAAGCSGVRVVATSRHHLGVPGETVHGLVGLRLEDDAPALYVDLVHRYLVAPEGAALDPELIRAVCSVSRGHPLTVELAVATLRRRPPAALLAALRSAPARLRGERSGRDERHASFEATFAYSWSLLDDESRAALAALSLFAGPFDDDEAAGALDVGPRAIARLVAQSLVGPAPNDRHELHPLVREVARARLGELDPAGRAEASYRGWALGWLGACAAGILTEVDPGLSRALERRQPDLHAAWLSACQRHDEAALAAGWPGARAWIELHEHALLGLAWCPPAVAAVGDAGLRADMVATLAFCLVLAGRAAEACDALEATLAPEEAALPAVVRVRVLTMLGRARASLGDLEGADDALARAAEAAAPIADPALHAWLRFGVLARHGSAGRNDLGGDTLEEAARFARAAGAGPLLRLALLQRGRWLSANWRPAEALAALDEARALALRAGDRACAFAVRRLEVSCLRNLGRMAEALSSLGDLQDEARALGLHAAVAGLAISEGIALLDVGRPAEAERALERALTAARSCRQAQSELHALLTLGNVRLVLGRYREAVDVVRRRRPVAARGGLATPGSEVLTCLALAFAWWLEGDNVEARLELEGARPLLHGLPSNLHWAFAQAAAVVEARDGRRAEAAAAALEALRRGAELGALGVQRSCFLLGFALLDCGAPELAAALLRFLREGPPLAERWAYLPPLERALAGVTPESPACADATDAEARLRARFEAIAAGAGEPGPRPG